MLHKAWTSVVTGPDLDRHMAANGQAAANAALFVAMLRAMRLPPGAPVLVPGAGTGQFLDYLDPGEIEPYRFTFTDINPSFLEMLRERAGRLPGIRFAAQADDVERPAAAGPFQAAIVVLVLEHIDWKVGVGALCAIGSPWLAFVIQRSEAGAAMASPREGTAPSMRAFLEMARPTLVPERDLIARLAEDGFSLHARWERPVPDEKVMVGLLFRRSTERAR